MRPGLRILWRFGPPTVFAALLIGAWYGARGLMSERRKFLIPTPPDVISDAFGNSDNRSEILDGLSNTAKVSFTGLAIAIVLGVLFSTAMSQAKWIERSFFPWAVVAQTVPILALVPLIGNWFGFDFRSRVIVAVIIAIFPIITNTLFGLQSAETNLHDLMTLHDASRLTRLRKLQFPAALPAMMTGFRISAGLSVIGAIVGEFFFQRGEKGLGTLLWKYRGLADMPPMYGVVIVSSVLGIAVFWSFTYLMQRTTSWHEAT